MALLRRKYSALNRLGNFLVKSYRIVLEIYFILTRRMRLKLAGRDDIWSETCSPHCKRFRLVFIRLLKKISFASKWFQVVRFLRLRDWNPEIRPHVISFVKSFLLIIDDARI